MKQSDDLDDLIAQYRARFNSLPVGFNYAPLTVEALRSALETGKEIESLPVEDGADE